MAAPQLLSGWGARFLKNAIEARIDGEVEIYDLELSWRQYQRAGRVTVHATPGPDGKKGQEVAEFALRVPSLLDLLEGPSEEWKFNLTDAILTVRVDADGTSDLGRCLGLHANDGRSEIHGLLAALSRGFAPDGEGGRRSIRTTVAVREARFIDMASGEGTDREEATVSDLALVATRSRVGFQVELENATVQHSVSEEARVSFAMNFGGPNSAEPILQSATIKADPIPLAALRLLGIMPRTGAGAPGGGAGRSAMGGRRTAFQTRDAYGSMANSLVQAAEFFLEEGASVDATYGARVLAEARLGTEGEPAGASPAPPADAAGARLAVSLKGDVGTLDLVATHIGSLLVGEPAEGEGNSLDLGFRMPPGQLTKFLSRLVPEETVAFQEGRPDARWFLRSRRFQVPLAADALSVHRLFADSAPPAGATERPGSSARQVTARQVMTRQVSDALRRAGGKFTLASDGLSAAEVALWPAGAAEGSPFDRLDWTHRLTSLEFSGDLGVTARSRWRVAQSESDFAELSLSIPGVALSPGEDLSPRLDVRLPGISLGLVEALAPIPSNLSGLLPKRFDQLELRGVRLPQLLAGRANAPGAGRAGGRPIRVVALLDGTDRIAGTYEAGTMTIPRANVSVPLNQMYCDRVIRAYMPWFAEVKPGGGGPSERSLKISMRDFVFSIGAEAFEQDGEVELRSGPLRVKLHPVIASELSASERELQSQDPDDADGWIAWTPAPTLLSLKGLFVSYERIELPLSDDYVTTLEGQLNRMDGKYYLSGTVESDFIDGQADSDTFQVITISGKETEVGPAATVTFARGTIDPDLTELMKAAGDFVEKAK